MFLLFGRGTRHGLPRPSVDSPPTWEVEAEAQGLPDELADLAGLLDQQTESMLLGRGHGALLV
jgi:hypothetical protein